MKSDSYKTFTYPQEYDEELCEQFIHHFIGFSYHITVDILKRNGKYFGLDLCKTAALEGCFRAFCFLYKSEPDVSVWDYRRMKGLVRLHSKNCFWSFSIVFGFTPSSGQKFFPSGWDDYKEVFKNQMSKFNVSEELDINLINNIIGKMPEKQSQIHQLYLSGYDFAEISRKLGYKNKSSSLKMYDRTIKRAAKIIRGIDGKNEH